jgi:AcrR family transcriptional regulator
MEDKASDGRTSAKADATRQRILDSAKAEFLDKGYSGASLRVIARGAGVTTGALYGYFDDKNALFEALVGEHVGYFVQEFRKAQLSFREMSRERQRAEMHRHSRQALLRLVDYMFDHLDAFRLALRSASGSSYENWLEPVIAIEEESTRLFIESLRANGLPVRELDDALVHLLCTGFFHGIMETVLHDMDRTEARRDIELLREYSGAGWSALLGLDKPE